MALIGQARAKLGASFPLVGVAASGTVELADGAAEAPDVSAPEPNHTHLVLVPGSRLGDESVWLADAASQVADDNPSITVVVNGGEVTFDDIQRSVAEGRPVLVVAGSGRAADKLAAALQGRSQDRRAADLAAAGQVRAVKLGDGPHALARTVAAVLSAEAVGRPPPFEVYQDLLKADYEGLISGLRLPELRRRYLRQRWLDQLVFLEVHATRNRDRFYFWRLITIIGGVVVSAAASVQLNRPPETPLTWTIFIVSLLVAISAGVEGFFRYGDRWRQSRRMAELLKTEGWQFFQLTGHYQRYSTHASAFSLFAGRVEDILQQGVPRQDQRVAPAQTELPAEAPGGSEHKL